MIKFFIHFCSSAFVAVIIWTILFSHLAMRLFPLDYPTWKYKFSILKNSDISKEIIVLGDSLPNAAIAPNLISNQMINLSLSGGTPIEAYLYLRKYLETHKAPKKLILSFNPESFHPQNTFLYHTIMFNLFTYRDLLELAESIQGAKEISELYKQGIDLPISLTNFFQRHGLYKCLFYIDLSIANLSFSKYQFVNLKNLFDPKIFNQNQEILSKIMQNNGQNFFSPDGKNTSPSSDIRRNFSPHIIHTQYYDRLIKLAVDSGITTYAITPPLNEIYQNYLDKDYIENYLNFLKNLKTHNPKLLVLQEVVFYPPDFFFDPEHVNQKGMTKFSLLVKSVISQ